MLIIDAHLDLAWNALQWNRDLLQSVYTIRTLESGTAGKGRALGTVALPELAQGRVALCFATLLARSTGVPVAGLDYGSPAQAFAAAYGQLAYYQALEQQGAIRIITSAQDLERHMGEWRVWDHGQGAATDGPLLAAPPPLGCVISMEGADPVLSPEQLAAWHQAGLRLIGPAHYGPGRYAGGTGTELGLSRIGPELLDAMTELGIGLDITHLSDRAFWQALDRFGGPILASHSNSRVLVPHQRQLSDEQMGAVVARDGVIGAAMDAWMLQPGWTAGRTSFMDGPTLVEVVNQIERVCDLAGNTLHAAIGSDLDGGFGREQSPADLDTIADLQKLTDLLAWRRYSDADIANIMHGNWLRLLGTVLR
jgi:membrane dipeptidase